MVLKKTGWFGENKSELSLDWLLGLLGQKNGLDVGQNTALCNGDAGEELVKLDQ